MRALGRPSQHLRRRQVMHVQRAAQTPVVDHPPRVTQAGNEDARRLGGQHRRGHGQRRRGEHVAQRDASHIAHALDQAAQVA
ncbi:MAG: hypothetical protein ACK56I_23635, partial [bacterium]